MPVRRTKKGYGLSVRMKAILLLLAVLIYIPVKYVFLVGELDRLAVRQQIQAENLSALHEIHQLESRLEDTVTFLNRSGDGDAVTADIRSRLEGGLDDVERFARKHPDAAPGMRKQLPELRSALAGLGPGTAHGGFRQGWISRFLSLSDMLHGHETKLAQESMRQESFIQQYLANMKDTARVSFVVGLLAVFGGSWLIFRNMLHPLTTMRKALVSAGRDPENAEKYVVDIRDGNRDVSETINAMNILLLQVSSGLEDLIASENRSRARSRELRAILDSVIDGIITADEKGRILSFNASAEYIFGYTAKEIIGRNLSVLMPEPYAAEHDGYLDSYVRTGQAHIMGAGPREVTAKRADGTTFPVDLAVSEAAPGGRRIFIGAVRDISDRALAREQIERTNRMDAIGEMTGGLAHDFNNMLTVISGNLEMIGDMAGDKDAVSAFARTAEKAAARGADLTQRLLTFSRKQDLLPAFTHLDGVVQGSVELIRRGLEENHSVELEVQEGLWPVRIDRSQLDNALVNLAFNARDAMGEGGAIRILVENVTLTDRFAGELPEVMPGEYVRISVMDTGTGIPPEVLDRVYEPFFTTKSDGKGTGLGLSMVYGFIRQSGGAVYIESVPGKGTAVNLLLPHCRMAGRLEKDALADEYAEAEPDLTGEGEVLVVEDDRDLREHVCNLLRTAGFSVRAAETGVEAIAMMDDIKALDLLLTDVVMPGGMTGEDVALQAKDNFPQIRVIYMSGYTRETLTEGGRIKPGVVLLQKPFTRRRLVGEVKRMLRGGKNDQPVTDRSVTKEAHDASS